MKNVSRTEHSARNTTVAVISRVTAILLGFAGRVVFTHTLSEDYVGINGLFSDILNVLALSEMGVGTAITFALYKPIAQGDKEKQKTLMRMFRTFYRIVAASVLVLGLLVLPFMDVLIKNKPDVDHLKLIYLMYLANSVASYLGIYKKTLIDAHQQNFISTLVQTGSWIVQNIIQIIVLVVTRNYFLYLTIWIACTVAGNICVSLVADKMFPYLRDKKVMPLEKEERRDIWVAIKSMLMHKVGNVLVNNTDNLLLSALVGTGAVGCYSNYFLIIKSIQQVTEQMFQGMMASVGNMGVTDSKERIKKIFEATFFIGQWVFGLLTVCIYEVIDLFVAKSFGQQYRFTGYITLVLCLNFYFTGMRQPTLIFRDSMGLFKYDRYKAIAEAMINLVVSLVLGHYMGTIGVFLGTLASTLLTSFWVEPYVLYKHKIESSCAVYFGKYLLYTAVTFALWFGIDRLCGLISGESWATLIIRLLIAFVVVNAVYMILYFRTWEFRFLLEKARVLIAKRFKR